jgi:hypothetical protein
MSTVSATFRGGAFIPDQPLLLPDGTRVELQVLALPPEESGITRSERMKALVTRMKRAALDDTAPPLPFSRAELHERR